MSGGSYYFIRVHYKNHQPLASKLGLACILDTSYSFLCNKVTVTCTQLFIIIQFNY